MYALRPITDEERGLLDELGVLERQPVRWFPCVAFAMVAAVSVFVVFAISTQLLVELYWPRLRQPLAAASFLTLPATFIGVLAYRLRAARRDADTVNGRRAGYRREVDAGVVEAGRFKTEAVVMFAMIADEGPRFCFRLTDGQAIVLRTGDEPGHPGSDFELVRLPESKLILRCTQHGGQLVPEAELPADHDGYNMLDGEPFAVDWLRLVAGKIQI